jgi:hypothetical protein
MNIRLLMTIATTGVALASSGVASANSDYWRQNGLLAEVSADPRDGSDFVDVNPMRADAVELVALNAPVDLRGVTFQFSDGRSFHAFAHGVMPGQPMTVELPRNCGVITNVELDYIPADWRRSDRTPARLQLLPIAQSYQQHSYEPGYQRPSNYQRPSYTVRPRHNWSGYISSSFRF